MYPWPDGGMGGRRMAERRAHFHAPLRVGRTGNGSVGCPLDIPVARPAVPRIWGMDTVAGATLGAFRKPQRKVVRRFMAIFPVNAARDCRWIEPR